MSAIPLVERHVGTRTFPSARPAIRPRQRTRTHESPISVDSPSIRARKRSRDTVFEYSVVYTIGFVLLAATVFMTSSLVGHMMLEKARRDTIQSKARLAVASKAVAVLNDQVDGMSTDANIEKFALSNSFVPQEEAEQGNGQATR